MKHPFDKAGVTTPLALLGLILACWMGCGVRAQAAEPQPLADAQEVWRAYGHMAPLIKSVLNEQTMVQRVRAAELPGVDKGRIGAVSPAVRNDSYERTGQTKPPVLAVRCDASGPSLKLAPVELAVGCYGVRVIGMVQSDEIQKYRLPLYVELVVEGPAGVATERYRQRVPYWDDFYSVTELYFNVDVAGPRRVSVSVGSGSAVSLHVNRLELHDVLKPVARSAAKTKPAFWDEASRSLLRAHSQPAQVLSKVQPWTGRLDEYITKPESTPELTAAQRAARDEAFWRAMPPINSQFLGWFPTGFPQKEIHAPASVTGDPRFAESGVWRWTATAQPWLAPLELVNEKLGLRYGPEDWANYRPLPKPYPWPDDGGAFYIPADKGAANGDNYAVLATLLKARWTSMVGLLGPWDGDDIDNRLPLLYHALGNRRAARDAALLLCRWAYVYPTFTQAQVIDYSLINPASIYNRDLRLRTRYVNDGLHGLQQGLAQSYDLLFDFIAGNDELAQAVGRFVPWVKTEADVRKLIETRVLQFGARQLMHFNLYSDGHHPKMLFRMALVQQDPAITAPWMEFLWSRTWIYPNPPAGLPDYLSTGITRDGTTHIGSVFYTGQGSSLADLALWSRRYVQNGGDARYDLSDPRLYAKLSHAGSFILDKTVAGGSPLGIGDVGGPDQPRMLDTNFSAVESKLRDGYALGGDPRVAWMIREYFGRGAADDATWARINRDADACGSHPLLTPNPRVLANWAGVLETGDPRGDFRLMTAASLRIGTGHGHAHEDTLDLQVHALGVRMVNDLGWRDSYSTPKATVTQLHNLVEVDEQNWQGHAWIDAFVPGRETSFLRGRATPPERLPQVTSRSRAITLVQVDTGRPGTPEPGRYTNATRMSGDVTLPQSYVFDVQRTAGGKLHTWCFHGTISDGFEWNAGRFDPKLQEGETHYLRRFLQGDHVKFSGAAPSTLVATWRVRREPHTLKATSRDGVALTMAQKGGEELMLGGAFDPTGPRRFTRVHLVNHGASRALVGHPQPNVEAVEQTWPFLFVQRTAEKDLQTVFASVIEPFAGQAFIRQVVPVPTGDESNDSARAVAVRVELVDGRTDLHYSDERGEARSVGDVSVQGRSAAVRTGPKGLEWLELVEGQRLAGPWGELTMPAASRKARVTGVDYLSREVRIEGTDEALGGVWKGQQVEFGNDEHRTSYTVTQSRRDGAQMWLTLDKSLDLSYARIVSVDPGKREVEVTVVPGTVSHKGMSSGLTCTVGDGSRAWRCRVSGSAKRTYQMDSPFDASDFPVGSVLRLWELGVGDEARLVNHARVRRAAGQGWEVTSNTDARFVPAK
jgi:hypothetical protein